MSDKTIIEQYADFIATEDGYGYRFLNESTDISRYVPGVEKTKEGGYRPHVRDREDGSTVFLSDVAYKKRKHATDHAEQWIDAVRRNPKSFPRIKVDRSKLVEEVEQLDEISKKTVLSYLDKAKKSEAVLRNKADKAGKQYRYQVWQKNDNIRQYGESPNSGNDALIVKSQKDMIEYGTKASKRREGIERATNQLTKEEVEQLDETSKNIKAQSKELVNEVYINPADLYTVGHHILQHYPTVAHAIVAGTAAATAAGVGSIFYKEIKKKKDIADKLKQIHANRVAGAKQAAKTRRQKVDEEVEQLDEVVTSPS